MRRCRLCSSVAAPLARAGLPRCSLLIASPCHGFLLLPFPCCWFEELLLTWLISRPSKNCLEAPPVIHPVYLVQRPEAVAKGEGAIGGRGPAFLCDSHNSPSRRLELTGAWRLLYLVMLHKWLLPPSPPACGAKLRRPCPGNGGGPGHSPAFAALLPRQRLTHLQSWPRARCRGSCIPSPSVGDGW